MQKIIAEFNKSQQTKKNPDFKSGDVIRVYRKIKEGEKERIQVFEGIVIAIKAKQSSSPMVTVRKISEGVGVELILPIHSPKIEKIELVKRAKVRKAKLYYLRGLTARESRMKNKDLSDFAPKKEDKEAVEEKKEIVKDEQIKEEKK